MTPVSGMPCVPADVMAASATGDDRTIESVLEDATAFAAVSAVGTQPQLALGRSSVGCCGSSCRSRRRWHLRSLPGSATEKSDTRFEKMMEMVAQVSGAVSAVSLHFCALLGLCDSSDDENPPDAANMWNPLLALALH